MEIRLKNNNEHKAIVVSNNLKNSEASFQNLKEKLIAISN